MSRPVCAPPSAAITDDVAELRGWRIQALALVALAASLVYLGWRTFFTVDLSVWWLSVPLLAVEVHAVAGLALFTFSLWDLDAIRPPAPRRDTAHRIAVLIPTYNEPTEILLPTVAAAAALQPAHETWVLDDGDRAEVRRLALDLGARYLTRPDRAHAKAGNINHALASIDADLVAVLDADHVAAPGLLTHTLGYFDDPRVAVVQTPQEFYNVDSFEHQDRPAPGRRWRRRQDLAGRRFSEQALFYRVVQPGKNRWGGAFWCGTGAMVRVAALREVGGVATETVTEDIHTTIRLHRRGWRSVYHNEVLSRGLAAADASQYQLQRYRWGTGAMQVLRTENPLIVPGLRLTQRLAYASTLLGWFDAWRSLAFAVLPAAVLFTGAAPIRADMRTFLVAFASTFTLQRLALVQLARGRAPQLLSTVFELVRMEANIRATLTLFSRRPRPFLVTPKGRVESGRQRQRYPVLLTALLVLGGVAAGWSVLTALGATPLHYGVPWAAEGAAFWLLLNGALIAAAIARVRSERFAAERRASVRFDVSVAGRLDEISCEVIDLSLTGAAVHLPVEAAGDLHAGRSASLSFVLGAPLILQARVRSLRPGPDGTVALGLEFDQGQDQERARLALALFHSETAVSFIDAGIADRDAA
jgi:cellulose synthase (UDP-forming)